MSDSNYRPDGSGVVMGDTKAMPDQGTGTGLTGYDPQLDGTSIDLNATNSMGSISGATGSDAPGEDCADDPTFGANAADKAEDAAEGM